MRRVAQKTPEAASAKSATPVRAHVEQTHELSPLNRLQRKIGNRALQRMLQENPFAIGSAESNQQVRGDKAAGNASGALLAQLQRAEGTADKDQSTPGTMQDNGIITITVERGQTLYSIAKQHGTTVQELQRLNNLKTTDIKEGQKLKVPTKSLGEQTAKTSTGAESTTDSTKTSTATPELAGDSTKTATVAADKNKPDDDAESKKKADDEKKVTIRGDPKGKKRLLVAWTIDDGPRGKITEKMHTVGMGGIPQATWFIQYNRIKTKEDWQKLRDVQAAGGEIAIHSFYQDDEHVPYFPKVAVEGVYGAKHVNDVMASRMGALKQFVQKLNDEKIVAKFVRLPGGLISELMNYAAAEGYGSSAKTIAKAIIAGTDVKTHGEKAVQMAADFALLKTTLNDLNLLLWGSGDLSVNESPTAIGLQEWAAETSGAHGREDYTTDVVDPEASKKTTLPGGHGSFERLIATMKDGDVKGMVILTHDTLVPTDKSNQDDVRAVKDDRERMEKVCAEKGIQLEYRTMSSLFTEVTGEDIASYKASY